MRLKIFLFSLILISINEFFAQNLKGIYVLNEITKKPISSVLISDFNDGFQEVSDENGFVSLQNFKSENQKIYVSGIGYEKEEFNLNSIKKEKDFGYIFLNPKIVSIEEVQLKNSTKNNIFSDDFRFRYSSSPD